MFDGQKDATLCVAKLSAHEIPTLKQRGVGGAHADCCLVQKQSRFVVHQPYGHRLNTNFLKKHSEELNNHKVGQTHRSYSQKMECVSDRATRNGETKYR